MKHILMYLVLFGVQTELAAQEILALDTNNFKIRGSYFFEKHRGKDAIYIKGSIIPKEIKFKNGTIEFDIFLKEQQSFPGLVFRIVDNDAEQFFLRPHLSGKPDANQAAPIIKGLTPWQLYFGPKYSFQYEYKYDDWTHVKVVVNENMAQAYLDHSKIPNISWNLFHSAREGELTIRAGGASAMHLANIIINKEKLKMLDFNPIKRDPIKGLIQEWEISDMFEEKLLNNPDSISFLVDQRSWQGKIKVEEGTAANISRLQLLYNGEPGEAVFAKITINSTKDQVTLFHFGYSDRVVAILNNRAIYKGNNGWRTRDYRYLGTVGLFDAIYLDLKKGNNTLLMAVSESFGGWLITGKFEDEDGLRINP